MLWVTITIVYWVFNWKIRSSILAVETGSSAEAGSSISSTSGPTARGRAEQTRSECLLQIVLYFVEERSVLQRTLHHLVHNPAFAEAIQTETRDYIVIDR